MQSVFRDEVIEKKKRGSKEARKQGSKKAREQGNKEVRKQGSKEARKQGRKEGESRNVKRGCKSVRLQEGERVCMTVCGQERVTCVCILPGQNGMGSRACGCR